MEPRNEHKEVGAPLGLRREEEEEEYIKWNDRRSWLCIPAQKDFVYLSYTSNLRGTPIKSVGSLLAENIGRTLYPPPPPQVEDEKMRRVKREGPP